MRSSEDILAEISQVVGYVPAPLAAAAGSASCLATLWQDYLACYLHNPLPPLLKEAFLALLSRRHREAGCLVARCCRLRMAGAEAREIQSLICDAAPSQPALVQLLDSLVGEQKRPVPLPPASSRLGRALLWAALRLAKGNDRGGNCAERLANCFGEGTLHSFLQLAAYAAAERLWCDASPQISFDREAGIPEMRTQLEAESPELASYWRRYSRRKRRMPLRERRLVTELAAQDRYRAALEESEQRFRAVIASSPHPMMVYADDGQVVMINRAWAQASGWDYRQITTLQEWVRLAEADGAADPGQFMAEVDALYESEDPIDEGEVTVRSRENGKRVWTMTSARLGKLADGRRAVLRMGVDVTDRRSLEVALWDANRKMSRILESVSDGFISVDAQGRFLFVNREAERMLGLSREQLVGRQLRDLTRGKEGEAFLKHVLLAVDAARDRSGEMQVGDRILKYRIYASEPARSIFLEDVTTQRRTERALAESQENLRLVVSAIPEVFWVQEVPSLRVLYITPSYEQLWGRSLESLSKDPLGWFAAVHEADRERIRDSVARTLAGEQTEDEYRIVTGEGTIRWVRTRCTPLRGEDGRFGRIVGIAQEVTAQREAEASLRAGQRLLRDVTDAMHAMVFMATPDAERMLYISPGVQHIWQYSQEEAYAICTMDGWQSVVHEEDRGRVREALQAAAQTGEDSTISCRIIRKDGALREIRARLSAVSEPEGGVAYVIGIAEDITEDLKARRMCRSLKVD